MIILLILFFLIGCHDRVELITDRIFESQKYECSAGNMDLSPYLIIGDSTFLSLINNVNSCLSMHIIDGRKIALKEERMKTINARTIGLSCEKGLLISNDYLLIDRLFFYELARGREFCEANSYPEPEEEEKKEL